MRNFLLITSLLFMGCVASKKNGSSEQQLQRTETKQDRANHTRALLTIKPEQQLSLLFTPDRIAYSSDGKWAAGITEQEISICEMITESCNSSIFYPSSLIKGNKLTQVFFLSNEQAKSAEKEPSYRILLLHENGLLSSVQFLPEKPKQAPILSAFRWNTSIVELSATSTDRITTAERSGRISQWNPSLEFPKSTQIILHSPKEDKDAEFPSLKTTWKFKQEDPDITTKEPLFLFSWTFPYPISMASLSKNGSRVLIVPGNTQRKGSPVFYNPDVYLVDYTNGKSRILPSTNRSVEHAVLSPDGEFFSLARSNGKITVESTFADPITKESFSAQLFQPGGASCLSFSNNNHFLLSCGKTGDVSVYSLEKKKIIAQLSSSKNRITQAKVLFPNNAEESFFIGYSPTNNGLQTWKLSEQMLLPINDSAPTKQRSSEVSPTDKIAELLLEPNSSNKDKQTSPNSIRTLEKEKIRIETNYQYYIVLNDLGQPYSLSFFAKAKKAYVPVKVSFTNEQIVALSGTKFLTKRENSFLLRDAKTGSITAELPQAVLPAWGTVAKDPRLPELAPISLSPSGDFILITSAPCTALLYNVANPKNIKTQTLSFVSPETSCDEASFHMVDNEHILSIGTKITDEMNPDNVRIWQINNGNPLLKGSLVAQQTASPGDSVSSFPMSPYVIISSSSSSKKQLINLNLLRGVLTEEERTIPLLTANRVQFLSPTRFLFWNPLPENTEPTDVLSPSSQSDHPISKTTQIYDLRKSSFIFEEVVFPTDFSDLAVSVRGDAIALLSPLSEVKYYAPFAQTWAPIKVSWKSKSEKTARISFRYLDGALIAISNLGNSKFIKIPKTKKKQAPRSKALVS